MSDKEKLDEFWDLSSLVPKKSVSFSPAPSVESVEITVPPSENNSSDSESDTVIKRYIPPYNGNSKLTLDEQFEKIESYEPKSALIHRVTVKKKKTQYNYYAEFLKNAMEYIDVKGVRCDFVPFFSYVPMYDQMTREQLSYYFWFRENARKGTYIKTDYGYLFVYIFEILNLGRRLDVKQSQHILMSLWNEYQEEYPAISGKLADWICDYSLLHRLPPPTSVSSKIIQKVHSLKEYFICLPKDDMQRSVMTLMRYCSSYDYKTSKFYTPQNKSLFDKYIVGALTVAVEFYSANGNILSGFDGNDSTVSRDIYAGAVCVAEQRYRIKVSYCSFSRSNELRFLIGDIIKYSENKLRAYIGVKSKMTVYSLSTELRGLIDNYFGQSLPQKRQAKSVIEKHDYDTLYDIPKKPLSLSNAAKIEEISWNTTNELVGAFEEENEVQVQSEKAVKLEEAPVEFTEKRNNDAFAQYRNIISATINGDKNAIKTFAKGQGKMADSVVEAINEIAYEVFGDLLVEDDGMGNYTVIEDYRNHFI